MTGYRVIDTDAHVSPAVELLYEEGEGLFRGRWDSLAPLLRHKVPRRPELGDWQRDSLELAREERYTRALGEHNGSVSSGGGVATQPALRPAPEGIEEGILHDNPGGRLRALDRMGIDVQLIAPGPETAMSAALDPALSTGMIGAYNDYVSHYCEADADRLKAVMAVHGGFPDWSADEIGRHAGERTIAAVALCLPEGVPLDAPALDPIWTAMSEAGLPLFHHAFPEAWPYFPGHADVWDNREVAHAAAHQWSAQRTLAFLILGGVLDRHPDLRVGFGDAGAGWLPSWLCQLRGQARHRSGSLPPLERDPLDYAREGRIFVALEWYEGEEIAASVANLVGDDVLMWQSHFPYGDPDVPSGPEVIAGWTTMEETRKRKLLAENAERFLRIM